MVLDAEKRSFRAASCWRVEVMNGGDGFFLRSPRSTVLTTNAACSSSATMAWVSSPVDGTIFSPAFSRSVATNSGGTAAAR